LIYIKLKLLLFNLKSTSYKNLNIEYKDFLVLSDETCASVSADAKSFHYTVQTMNDMQAYAHHWTVYKNQLRDTVSATTLPL
jgi:hypothetical protein